MAVVVITPATVQAVTLDEVKEHLRVTWPEDDSLIDGLIGAATATVEHWLSRSLATQTLELRLDAFPKDVAILPRGPVQSIASIKYDDIGAAEQTLPADSYRLDTSTDKFGQVYPVAPWPAAYDASSAVRFRYVTGFPLDAGQATTPQPIRVAIMLMVGHWYINTEAVASGSMTQMTLGVQELIAPYRVITV